MNQSKVLFVVVRFARVDVRGHLQWRAHNHFHRPLVVLDQEGVTDFDDASRYQCHSTTMMMNNHLWKQMPILLQKLVDFVERSWVLLSYWLSLVDVG